MRYYQFIPTADLFYFLVHRLELERYEEIKELIYVRANIYQLSGDVIVWCNNEIGIFEDRWDYAFVGNKHTMYFGNIEDAMAFKLRWI